MKAIAIIGIVVIMLGIILIYDARDFAKHFFSFSDQNSATLALKVVGLILSIVGGLLVLFA